MAEAVNINNRDFDAKGDLLVGTADNAFDQLAVGTNDFQLVADSTAATGLAYARANPLFGRSYRTGCYYASYIENGQVVFNVVPTTNLLFCVPFLVRKSFTADRISGFLNTNGAANSVWRLGIYNDDGSAYPGSLLLDAGTVAVSAGAPSTKEITISQALTPGLYWLAYVAQVAASGQVAAVVSTNAMLHFMTSGTTVSGNGAGYSESGVSGALPANFTSSLTKQNAPPVLWLRST